MLGLAFLGKKTRNVKDLILLILLDEFPLKAKLIYNRIKKKYGVSVTYQGAHKALMQLHEQGIISKEKNEYQLDPQWVSKVELFVEMFKTTNKEGAANYVKAISEIREQGDVRIVTVKNCFEAQRAQYILRQRFREKFNKLDIKDKPIRVTHLNHLYRFILHTLDAHADYQDDSNRYHHYYLIESNSAVDQESLSYIHSYPGPKKYDRFIMGTNLPRNCQLAVYDDIVFEVHIPEKILAKMNTFFSVNSLAEFDVPGFFTQVVKAPAKVKLVIYKDRELAKKISADTIARFEK